MTVLNKTEVLALRGLRLPPVVLKEIQRAGIYCQPAISIEYQRHAQRYLIRGVESGGAVSRLGLYCAFIDERGAPLTTVQPVSSVGVNGIHAAVLSPAFIRVQIVRSGRHYELLLTHHGLVSTEGKTRPSLSSSVLFHGQHGRLELELWGKDSCLRGTFGPFFYSRSGEQVVPPDRFYDSILRVTAGACCVGCRHAHVAGSGTPADKELPQ